MKNAYVEITNICNLDCDFCPGHGRKLKHMTSEEFSKVAEKLNGRIENLFLHLMGEPLLHPELDGILKTADRMDIKLKITTNGTLLSMQLPLLLKSKNLHTVCISLHSFGGNFEGGMAKQKLEKYLRGCLEGAKKLAKHGKFAVLRLWNLDENGNSAADSFNAETMRLIGEYFPREKEEWVKTHRGERVATHVFIEWGERFDWPDITDEIPEAEDTGEYGSDNCHGLLSQIGILSDGTIVPCCLDRNGDIPLGNIFDTDLESALASPRAKNMKEAMAHHRFIEPLCRTCGFKRK
ncbi:MAG: radical SAM protein [Clostridia bacterium]|nr:radical SAM protein [Clostridia bacterium]